MNSKIDKLRGVYAITDPYLTPNDKVEQMVEEALKGGAQIIQLRDKEASDESLFPIAVALQKLCSDYQSVFFINDRVDLAIQVKADGVHVGFHDEAVNSVRLKVGNEMLIGVSCYGDIERAKNAIQQGADYVAFGAFFPSKTKPKAAVVPMEVIKEAKETLDVPVCIIGGINEANIDEFDTYSPDMYAMVSDIFESENIQQKVEKLKSKIENSTLAH